MRVKKWHELREWQQSLLAVLAVYLLACTEIAVVLLLAGWR